MSTRTVIAIGYLMLICLSDICKHLYLSRAFSLCCLRLWALH